jgi:hypothetical protein
MIISCLIFRILSANKVVHASFEFTFNFLKRRCDYAFKFILLFRSKNYSCLVFEKVTAEEPSVNIIKYFKIKYKFMKLK